MTDTKLHLLLLMALAASFSFCQTKIARELSNTGEPPFEPAGIEALISEFGRDTTMLMQGAFPNLPAAIEEYQFSSNKKGVKKIYKFHRDFNGSREQLFYIRSNEEELIYSEEKTIRKACPDLHRDCIMQQQYYYQAGRLKQLKSSRDTIPGGNVPRLEQARTTTVREDLAPYEAQNLRVYRSLLTQLDTVQLQQGQHLQGAYRYLGDVAYFVDCRDKKIYDVESRALEKAYLQVGGDGTSARTRVIGYYTILPNMDDRLSPHLIVLKVLGVKAGLGCE